MRAVLLTDYGDVEKLELREVPEPEVGPGELKIRVIGSSVNPIDWKLRSGIFRERIHLELPFVLGRDASGEVVEVGESVTAFGIGAKVLGLVPGGAYAEYVVAKEEAWTEVPASMDLVDAAALPLAALAGSQLIDEGVRPRLGDVVLVTGAIGSVGRATVFTAGSRGAKVLAGVRRKQKDEAAKLNVDGVVALDDDAELAQLPKLDAIADIVGGPTVQQLLGKVKAGGTIGSLAGEPAGAKERGLVVRACTVHPNPKRLAELANAAAAGELVIPIAKRMPLAQIREAQTIAESGAGGKVMLQVR
jgi:NADPH:quinone reductase-like Zn-dependent oxidoreductase